MESVFRFSNCLVTKRPKHFQFRTRFLKRLNDSGPGLGIFHKMSPKTRHNFFKQNHWKDSFKFYFYIQQNQEQIALIFHQIDLTHDPRHHSTRLQTNGLKSDLTWFGFLGGKQVIKFANIRNCSRVCSFSRQQKVKNFLT